MKTGEVTFNVSGTLTQNFKVIVDDLTPADVIKKLQNGEALTTLSESKVILEIPSMRQIAKITDTDILNNTEYFDYE